MNLKDEKELTDDEPQSPLQRNVGNQVAGRDNRRGIRIDESPILCGWDWVS